MATSEPAEGGNSKFEALSRHSFNVRPPSRRRRDYEGWKGGRKLETNSNSKNSNDRNVATTIEVIPLYDDKILN